MTQSEKENCHRLYYIASAADAAYSEALRKEYGKNACNIRYTPHLQTADIRALGIAKVQADDSYLDACNTMRYNTAA